MKPAPARLSRLSSLQHVRFLLLSFSCLAMIQFVGCKSAKPRNHWWQFWRPKANEASQIYNPDTVVLPPPPDVADGSGSSMPVAPDKNLPAPPGSTIEPNPLRRATQGTVSQLQTVYFDFDSAELSSRAISMLDQNAEWLQQNAGLDIQLEGHTDERGTVEYNLNLGDRRAKAVKEYLMSKGITGEHLHTISYGEERPIDPGQNEAAFGKNRRVQFLLY